MTRLMTGFVCVVIVLLVELIIAMTPIPVHTAPMVMDVCSDANTEGAWALSGFQTASSDLDWTNLQIENEVYLGTWDPNSTDGKQLLTEQSTDNATMTAMNTIMDEDIAVLRANQCPKMF